jgi:hypothetical protein
MSGALLTVAPPAVSSLVVELSPVVEQVGGVVMPPSDPLDVDPELVESEQSGGVHAPD